MSWIDLFLTLVMGWSVLSGFLAGFARVGIGFIASLVGVIAGFWCYGIAGDYVSDYVSSRSMANLIGFFLVFLGVVAVGAIVGRLLAMFFKWAGLSWFDRLLGAVFGLVRGLFLAVAMVTVFLAFGPSPPPRSLQDSRVIPYVLGASAFVTSVTPHEIRDAFRHAQENLTDAWAHRSKPNEKAPATPLKKQDL